MSDPWDNLRRLVVWLNDANGVGDIQEARQIMKVFEEGGEAVQAYIGMTGQNPRKGVTGHTRQDVAGELLDTAISALVAAHAFSDDVPRDFAAKLDSITARIGI